MDKDAARARVCMRCSGDAVVPQPATRRRLGATVPHSACPEPAGASAPSCLTTRSSTSTRLLQNGKSRKSLPSLVLGILGVEYWADNKLLKKESKPRIYAFARIDDIHSFSHSEIFILEKIWKKYRFFFEKYIRTFSSCQIHARGISRVARGRRSHMTKRAAAAVRRLLLSSALLATG